MEYDPAVSTHKASSITSTTSTSSSSTWDPISTPSYIHPLEQIKQEEQIDSFKEFELVSDRMTMPSYDYNGSEYNSQLTMYTSSLQVNNTNIKNSHLNSSNVTPAPIYLQHGDQITVPSISIIRKRPEQQPRPIRPSLPLIRQRSDSLSSSETNKRSKLNRDLLTDDEKRVNHIASEQKRRNTIRTGFKDLTDIIPTLKNINNSKSTILFKAVEYMKHLDKRNRGLREKIASLQMRLNVEGRMAEHRYRTSNTQRYNKVFTGTKDQSLPPQTVSALLAHKNQQRQLEELQKQLRLQQQLLVKHNLIAPSQELLAEYNSISIPSSSSTEDNEHTTTITTIASSYNSVPRPWQH